MTEHGAGDYKDLVVFLAAAGVVVPLFNRFKISPVLGFLAAGVLLGPYGLARFADALIKARPDLPPEAVYWRLHFCLGMTHNNRFAEFDRLHVLSDGLTREGDTDALLKRMLDFAEAGFLA